MSVPDLECAADLESMVMKSLATLADVAELAGVSRATASLALNGQPGPSAGTVEKVRQVADELGYRPSAKARRLRGAKSHCVALLTSAPEEVVGNESSFSFQIALAIPLSKLLLSQGYSMLLVPPLQSTTQLDGLDVDAAVVVEPRENDPIIEELRHRGVRTITVGEVPDLAVDGVVSRGFSGADVVIEHLLAVGSKNVVVVLAEDMNSVSFDVLRYVDEKRGTVDQGSSPSVEIRTLTVEIDAEGAEAKKAIGRHLQAHPEVDSIYAPTDLLAVAAQEAAGDLGLDIPGDLRVATNFNGPRAQQASPSLTAVDIDTDSVARACTELILDCVDDSGEVNDGAGDEVKRIRVPRPQLVVRDSTSPSAN